MPAAMRPVLWLLRLVGDALLVAVLAFALVQTRPVQAWLEKLPAIATSTANVHVAVTGLSGLVPFRFTVARIDIADRKGIFAVLHDVGFAIRAAPLLHGRVEIRAIGIGEAEVVRRPALPHPPRLPHPPHLPLVVLDRLAVGRLVLGAPHHGERIVATLSGHVALAEGRSEVALDLHRIDGQAGKLTLMAALFGAASRLDLHLAASEPSGRLLDRLLGRGDHLPLALSLDGDAPLADWHGRLSVSAGALARIDARLALAVTGGSAAGVSGMAVLAPLLPRGLAAILGNRIDFSLRATKTADRLVLGRLRVVTAAGELTGAGSLAAASARAGQGAIAVTLAAAVPQLARLGTVFGTSAAGTAELAATIGGNLERPLLDLRLSAHGLALRRAGVPPASATSLNLVAHAERQGASGFAATVDGAADGTRTGLAAADALMDGRITLAGAIHRGRDETVYFDRMALAGADVKLSGSGSFAPAARHLTADLAMAIPRLEPLGAVSGKRLAGALTANARLAGPLHRLRLDADVDARDLAIDGFGLDRLRFTAAIADLAAPRATLDGSFREGGLSGTVALAAELPDRSELVLPWLRLAAAGGGIDGALRVTRDTGLVQGRLDGNIPNFAPWSRLAGLPLAGSARFTATLAAQAGQALDFRLTATSLGVGAGTSRLAVGHAELETRFADLGRSPSGRGRLALSGLRLGHLPLAAANLAFDSLRPGRFGFHGGASAHALSLAFAGDAGREPDGATAYGLQLVRLDGSIAGENLRLERPLVFLRRGADFALSGRAIALGPGRIGGSGSLRGQSLALDLTAANLPLAPAARLLGHPSLHGALSLSAAVGGTLAMPRGHLAAAIRGLGFAKPIAANPPQPGVTLSGDWDGRRLTLDGRVGGLAGDRVRFTGSFPLLLARRPLGLSVPRDGRLALGLNGEGDIGHLAELLPIGEDRISGKFTAVLSLGGTVAMPSAAGRVAIVDGRYENFASGAVLTGLNAVLSGDRNRLTLASFSAGDGATGKIGGEGSVSLEPAPALAGAAPGPSADFAVNVHDFRIAARDEALVKASGRLTLAGPLGGLTVTAPLTIDRADINLPNRLPPEIVVIHVVRVDGKTGKPVQPTSPTSAVLPARLDITLDMPGRVFVRGHGLDSDWRGRLSITGSAAAPRVAGTLVAIGGSFSLLGKTFQLTRGRIVFDGNSRPDPVLDIAAQVVAADITAEVRIGGLASAPKISLTSTPQLPQDEILSRVLFNQGKGQISAAQGLELAQAAAALAGQNFGTLDRLRGSLGLDWLGLGTGPQGAAPSIVNPNPNNTAQLNNSGNVVSAGKYVARGVSVGVTQGVSPPTSKVVVEVQLGNHLTVDTSAGQNSGTGIGINYNFDY
jgi:translocation and assembly module TamB